MGKRTVGKQRCDTALQGYDKARTTRNRFLKNQKNK